ncbi:MAG: DUF1330 domain-containing protein [Nitratireductor sp.]|nr:DUF1330 domain-containing protein [Nitratireductor sp.]
MPKGYWIAHINVHDPESYKNYVAGAMPAYQEYGAKFLVRGTPSEQVEGEGLGPRHVVIEFPTIEAARACYESATYRAAREHRLAASTGHIIISEGAE